MMKKLKISTLIILFISVFIVGFSYAAQLETTIEITPNVTEVSAGENVIFTFIVKDIVNANDDSIYAIEGRVTYDTDFFELVSGVTNTTFTAGGESGEMFNVLCSGAKEGEKVAILTLKVKDNPTGSGVVKFTDLSASDGDMDRADEAVATTADTEITINIKSDTVNDDQQEENTDNVEQQPEKIEEVKTEPTVDASIADTVLPKAGTSSYCVAGIVAVITIVITYIIYKKNQKYMDIK